MQKYNPFTTQSLLFVEGDSDVLFIQNLLRNTTCADKVRITNRDLNEPPPKSRFLVDIEACGSDSKVLKAFEQMSRELHVTLKTDRLKPFQERVIKTTRIVVLIDGDTHEEKQLLAKYQKALNKSPFKVDFLRANMLYQEPEYGIEFGIYILKDFVDDQFKDLESLLVYSLRENKIRELIQHYKEGAKIRGFSMTKKLTKRELALIWPALDEYEGNEIIVLKNHFDKYFDVASQEAIKPVLSLLEKMLK